MNKDKHVPKAIKKLSKADIIEFYHRITFPEQYALDFVPTDLKMKGMDKLMAWQGIELPAEVKEERKMEKMIFQIVCTDK